VNPLERAFRRLDGVQQRHGPLAVVFGVVKKFGDDNAGTMVSALAHAGFGTVFPLLLFLVTVSGMVVGGNSTLRHDVLHSAVSQFPIVGTDLQRNISALHRNSVAGLAVGLIGLVWGSAGLAQQGLFTMAQVWNLPGPQRPNYPKRLLRALGFLATLAIGTLTTTFFSAVTTAIHGSLWQRVAAVVITLAVSCGQYVVAFRVLTPRAVPWRKLVPGALVAGAGWTVLQQVGTLVVGHYLRNDSAVYGLFAIVIGLYAWIYLLAELTVYAAEINVVLARRLWPRAIVQPPLTSADRRSMAAQAHQNQRRPEQHVTVTFDGEAQTEDEFLGG
jgi:YihY family inner membrane protein